MVEYYIELRMADKELPITDEVERLIADCAAEASLTTVSKKNKRTFSVDRRLDDHTLLMKLRSRSSVNPTRTMSTLTRAVTRNEKLWLLVKDHIVNGLIFNMTLLSQQDSKIIHVPDTDIVSEIVSIFFKENYAPEEKQLAEKYAEELRKLIIRFKNDQMNLGSKSIE